MAKRKKPKVKRSSVFGVPAIVGQKIDVSYALRVGKRQIVKANEAAVSMGCGEPFRSDGLFEGTRSQKKQYMREINRRRVNQGQDRLVNFDGGYGDEI